tara:strand:+ start:255 stop:431 length:177 start_codon:yes stop_codon:yes gene_type:complete
MDCSNTKITISDLFQHLHTTVPCADYTGFEALAVAAPFVTAIVGIVIIAAITTWEMRK